MKCPKCNFDNDNDALFCEKCGEKLSKTQVKFPKIPQNIIKLNRKLKVMFGAIIGIMLLGYMGYVGPRIFFTLCMSYYDVYCYSSWDWHTGWYNVKKDGKYGFVCGTNDYTKIPLIYDGAGPFRWGLAPVKLGGKWGYINEEGNVVLDFKYEDARSFSIFSKLAPVKVDGKWGYVGIDGTIDIPCIYDEALQFEQPYNEIATIATAAVKLSNKWGFINTSGGVVIPFEIDDKDIEICYSKDFALAICKSVFINGKKKYGCDGNAMETIRNFNMDIIK